MNKFDTGDGTGFAAREAGKVSLSVRKNSARVKTLLLQHGVSDNRSLFEKTSDFKEEHYGYDNGNWGIDKGNEVPSEILLPGGITSKIHIRPDSPLRLIQQNDSLGVWDPNDKLSDASFFEKPNFWNQTTRNGIPMKRIAHLYGSTCLNFNIFSWCQFFKNNEECLFCSVQETQKTHGGVEIRKRVADLQDTCKAATQYDEIEWFLSTGGCLLDRDEETKKHCTILEAIRDHLPWGGRVRGNVALMPPKDMGLLKRLFETGVTHPSFNLEAWPEKNFEKFCPGKAKHVGFKHILKSFEELVSLYGPGNVWCNFVAGLTPMEELKEGFTAMTEIGVVPGANVYHPDVGSKLGPSLNSPEAEEIIELYLHAADCYRTLNCRPFFDASVLRNSLANEAYEGLLT